jgi:hypothetical protein
MASGVKHTRLGALRRQIARLQRRRQRLEDMSRAYSRGRTGIVLGGILVTLLMNRLFGEAIAWITLGVFAAVFLLVAFYHGRVKDGIIRYTIWLRLKTAHVARMTLDWAQLPLPPVVAPEAEHPFAADLNLTGERSLLRLIDTTRSREGSARLRAWLLHPVTDPVQVRARQDMVRELVPLMMFRDRLALNGDLVVKNPQIRWQGERLRQWLEQPPPRPSLTMWLSVLSILAVANIVLGMLYALGLAPGLWIVSFTVYVMLYYGKHRELSSLFAEAFHLEQTLHQFRAVLLYLETYSYGRTPHLASLCAPFWQAEVRPSACLKKIARIAGAASVQQGNLVGPLLNALGPWDLYFAQRLRQCKEEIRALLPVWLETWYELEALNALAHFGYMNPDYVFPEVLSTTHSEAVFWGRDLGHPLLPDEVRVCNDFALERLGQLVMVTGSNMSGKSTFLRTLGVNLCLAFSGAPVNATALRTVPFRIFTCMTVSDSVTDGISYFYAEVRRLKALLTALEQEHRLPLFFLIDEIFRGTNNRERLIGSRSYVQTLTGGNGVGVVSTHDLELVKLADEIPSIHNVHFREDVREGRMVFDYRLRPGPCPTTNALKIMRMEGLPVAPSPGDLPEM